jgi:hypothetical protein
MPELGRKRKDGKLNSKKQHYGSWHLLVDSFPTVQSHMDPDSTL